MTHRAPLPSISRRHLLRAGTLGLFSGLAGARQAGAAAGAARPAKACILVYLLGGPSHIDMWDLKPDAPPEVRGPFSPIRTTADGIEICEHLPRLARQAHRLALLRSVSHPNGDHPFMTYHTLTGRVSSTPLGANTVLPPSRNDDPHVGAVVARFRHSRREVPGYVAIPEVRVRMQPVPIAGGGRAGFLGAEYDPLCVNDDPRERLDGLDLPEGLSPARFDRRRSLLAMLDGAAPASGGQREFALFRDRAAGLVRATGADGLFSIDREPAPLRERYGADRFGQSLLLARRLVERGVSFAAVHFNHMTKCDGWDTHANNFECLKGELLPMLDRGLSALLSDLADRGMLEETLVVVMGEFGRTPQINAQAGRDHWGECASVVFAGGGMRGGAVVGASDRTGAYPVEDAVGPADVVATLYHALGLDPSTTMWDTFLQRPMPLSDGRPILKLLRA